MTPVTVLTGFLGSGKTTLLARLLKSPALARTAVIINEFGDIGIDHDLVEVGEESFVELETGCLCCSIRGDLEQTIADLLARRARGALPAFERIVIETSGLADPAPILQAIMSEAGRGGEIALGAVVTVVDCVTGLATLDREPQALRQAAVADRLIVTKADLVGAPPDGLLARLSAINPRAALVAASFGAVEPDFILDVGSGDPSRRSADAEAWLAADWTPHHHRAEHADGHVSGAHHGDIRCLALRREAPMRAVVLTLFLEVLADHCGSDLLRLKGIVNIAERPERPAVIHGVQHVFHAPAWLDRWPSDDRRTRMVLIGRNLSQTWIERLLDVLEAEVCEVDRGLPAA